jgi:hypothetical protein
MVESTDVCDRYRAGGPSVKRAGLNPAGSPNRPAPVPVSSPAAVTAESNADTMDWLVRQARDALTADGNLLTFLSVGTLALASAVRRDWLWSDETKNELPHVVGSDLRRYYYKRLPGGKQVEIYRPNGQIAVHRTTSAAARNQHQLADEVGTLVNDLYVEK